MSSDPSFSYKERLLVAPLLPGPTKQFFHVRMESAMTLTEEASANSQQFHVNPFPKQVKDMLKSHNATQIVVQVGTSSSHSFGHQPLDSVEPWHTSTRSTQGIRLDLGPSGVSVRASFQISNQNDAKAHWEALLHELVAQRILLAPLFSVSIRRLHRHWISWTDKNNNLQHFQLVLPMEGASLSSEGMHCLATAFSPCHNQSGIFNWNSPLEMSDFIVKRQSAERHSWWIQMEQQQQENDDTTVTAITKGMQFQPFVDSSQENLAVKLTDIFPNSKRHQACPFVGDTTLDTVKSSQVPLQLFDSGEDTMYEYESNLDSRALSDQYWKEPWMTISTPTTTTDTPQKPKPVWSVHQTLQRPRGVAYAGRLITQVIVDHSQAEEDCPVSVDLQWFLPPIVQPTWSSLRVVQEDTHAQVERELDWRRDLQGRILTIDPATGRSSRNLAFDEGTIYFRIPQWNVTGTTQQQTLTISLDYRPAFLSFENFPGDANRGVEIPPVVATFIDTCAPSPVQLYSNSLLLLPPVPDMSMPFNVLSMTCSLYAFVIGSLLNLMIRKTSERVQGTYDPSKIPPGKLKVLVGKIKSKLTALKGKLRGSKVEEDAPVEDTPSDTSTPQDEPDVAEESTTD